MEKIILNRKDYVRIQTCVSNAKQRRAINVLEAENLLNELKAAKIVEPQAVPSDVVTMNSIVKISFLNTQKQLQFQLVYPDQANVSEQKISILSPVAAALIGYKTGDEIDWVVPAGHTKIKIDEIIYQPEASGDYNA